MHQENDFQCSSIPDNLKSFDCHPSLRKIFTFFSLAVFIWCISGVCIIYGIRLFHDQPLHPSFMPIVYSVYSGVVSFVLIVTFKTIFDSKLEVKAKNMTLKGPSGPIAMWCICYSATFGSLLLVNVKDQPTPTQDYKSCSVSEMIYEDCSPLNNYGKNLDKNQHP